MTPDTALAQVFAQERGRLLAALVARTGDIQRAEDALHEAAAAALVHWGRAGVPDHPQGWLLRAALRKMIDGYRRDRTRANHVVERLALGEDEAMLADAPDIPDDRLRLIFTCCHPSLEEKTQVALTLRTLCGLSTAEVAAVFLDAEPTMGQRLTRARAKIAGARIPYVIPGPEDWPARLNSVLTVIYLIFTRGYALGPAQDRDLCEEALFLSRLLVDLSPETAEVEGCLALLLLTHARRAARIGAGGLIVPLADQDRSLWSRAMIDNGRSLLEQALSRQCPGPFQIKAAIAALHCDDGAVDWSQIAALYAALLAWEPGPVVRLNHAVAVAEARGPKAGLALIAGLAGDLAGYQPFHAAQAEFLARAGNVEAARAAYDAAIALAPSEADRLYLDARRQGLPENPAG